MPCPTGVMKDASTLAKLVAQPGGLHCALSASFSVESGEGDQCILPLLLDLTNPSPGIGWQNRERMSLMERGPADVVLALALVHHLAISNNVPLERVAAFFGGICRWLIVEFIPKEDSQVQRLLATREDIFPGYTQAGFESAFENEFVLHSAVALEESTRVLYLMERKASCS
jgi:hypothetical protein